MLKVAQFIEDLESHRELLPLNMKRVAITRACDDSSHSTEKLYWFQIPFAKIEALKRQELDEISLIFPFTLVKRHENKDIEVLGKITRISGNLVYFKTSFDFCKGIFIAKSVTFEYNRISTRATLEALSSISTPLIQYLSEFETPTVSIERYDKFCSSEFTDDDFIWFNKRVEGNKEQATAIKSIVNCTAFPYPYVIFGPPGKIEHNFS